jgi:hypothetical protein
MFEKDPSTDTDKTYAQKYQTLSYIHTHLLTYTHNTDTYMHAHTHTRTDPLSQPRGPDIHRGPDRIIWPAQNINLFHTYIHTQILSANREAQISIEDLIGSFDLRKTITRSQLDMSTDDLCVRASAPITELLNSVGLQLTDVDAFELIGNGWRMQV